MKSFGCLASIALTKSNEKEIIKFLVDNGIFQSTYKFLRYEFNRGELDIVFDPHTIVVEPTAQTCNEFCDFITKSYHYEIESEKHAFFASFNNSIYGLNFEEQKKIALEDFQEIYSTIDFAIEMFDNTTSYNGITHIKNDNRFKNLYIYRSNFYKTFTNEVMGNQFLIGNADYYSSSQFKDKFDIQIKNFINLQIDIQLMVALNDIYKFENDFYFTNFAAVKKKFDEYSHIFKTMAVYQFANTKILSFQTEKKANIDSLYATLVNLDLIVENKTAFKKFVLSEYNFEFAKINSYEKDINRSHDKRIEIFTSDALKSNLND